MAVPRHRTGTPPPVKGGNEKGHHFDGSAMVAMYATNARAVSGRADRRAIKQAASEDGPRGVRNSHGLIVPWLRANAAPARPPATQANWDSPVSGRR